MGVFSGLEGSLEKYIEGFFKDKFKGRVQPAEIAKKLAREMRDHRRTGINKSYAPNAFVVYLSPGDYADLATLSASLSQELQEYISQKAQEKRYTLTGAPLVEFAQEDGEETGYIRIVSGFSEEQPVQEPPPQAMEVLEQTQLFGATKEMVAVPRELLQNHWLEIAVGLDKGKIFNITTAGQIIGRHSGCDIVLLDSSISRRQARLERKGNHLTIEDLGSTNGTWVNGTRVNSMILTPGDEIALGTTVCVYRVD